MCYPWNDHIFGETCIIFLLGISKLRHCCLYMPVYLTTVLYIYILSHKISHALLSIWDVSLKVHWNSLWQPFDHGCPSSVVGWQQVMMSIAPLKVECNKANWLYAIYLSAHTHLRGENHRNVINTYHSMFLSTWYNYIGDSWWLCLSHISMGWLVKGRQNLKNKKYFWRLLTLTLGCSFFEVLPTGCPQKKQLNPYTVLSSLIGSEMCFSIRIRFFFSSVLYVWVWKLNMCQHISAWWFQPFWKYGVSWDSYSQYMEKIS